MHLYRLFFIPRKLNFQVGKHFTLVPHQMKTLVPDDVIDKDGTNDDTGLYQSVCQMDEWIV